MTIRITIACSSRPNIGLDIISGNLFQKGVRIFCVSIVGYHR